MKTHFKYFVLVEESPDKMETNMGRLSEEGWLPVGGVSITFVKGQIILAQTLVKETLEA